MTFPTVAAVAQSSEINGEPTTVSLPSGIASGDLLIVWFDSDSVETISDWDGFTELFVHTKDTSHTLWAAYRIADGGEGSTISVVISSAERTAHQSQRITNWHGTTPPEVSTATDANNDAPDPPSLTASWGSEDTLWMEGIGIDTGSVVVNTYSSSYTNGVQNNEGTGTGGANLATARRENAVETENPGTMGMDASDSHIVNTLAIRPAAAAGANPHGPFGHPFHGPFAGPVN